MNEQTVDIEELLQRISDLEDKKMNAERENRKRSDWLKILAGSALTAIVIISTILLDIGGTRKSLEITEHLVQQHIEEYTPQKAQQIADLEAKVQVHDAQITTIKEQLNRMEGKLDKALGRH